MTTNEPVGPDDQQKRLTEVILRGDQVDSERIARELARGRMQTNDVVDTISETMNIVADLHEVERYTPQQVESCERAAEKALEAVRPRIKVEQRRVTGKVMVTSLRGDPHTFDKTLLLTMLEIGGFSALDGGEELTPEDISRKVSAAKPDVVAIPLVTNSSVQGLMDTRTKLNTAGSKTKIIAYGRGIAGLPSDKGSISAEEDSLGALSKIAEILLSR
jgi:methanogenic corrinoid protein MtbC1